MRTGISAGDGADGAAAPVRRVTAARLARKTMLRAFRWSRKRPLTPPRTRTSQRKTNPTTNPKWFGPISREAANDVPAVADVAADAAGAADRKTVSWDRSL